MSRKHGTKKDGRAFTDEEIQQVWDLGVKIPGENPVLKRKDTYGAIIERYKYGDDSDKFNTGWEIDHIKPISRNGSDHIANLQPLQWFNNRSKSDKIYEPFETVKAK